MEKKINLNQNFQLAEDMKACAMLLEIALTKPADQKISSAAMSAAKHTLLQGANVLCNTTESMIALLKVMVHERAQKVCIPREKTEELAKSLFELAGILGGIADALEEVVKENGDTV